MTLTTLDGFSAAVAAQVVTTLTAVSGVVNVRQGEPHVPDWPTFLDAFRQVADGTIQGWILVQPEVIEARDCSRADLVTVRILLRGFRSTDLAAGSRAAFRAVVERVIDAFRNSTLGGLVEVTDPIQSRLEHEALTEDRLLGDVLCHVAELELVGTEWLHF